MALSRQKKTKKEFVADRTKLLARKKRVKMGGPESSGGKPREGRAGTPRERGW